MARVLVISLLVTTQLGLTLCGKTADNALSEAANCFTLNFYKQLTKGKGSMVSSPFSLDVLLSLLRVGSGGNTEQELTKALGYQGLSVQDMQAAYKSKLDQLKGSSGNTLELANSLWIQQDFKVKQGFKDDATNNFYAQISNVDFRTKSKQSTDQINSWGKDKTHGLIPVLFGEPLAPSTVLVLVNAIYFKGEWQTKFEKEDTQLGKFYNNDSKNNPSKVKLMNLQSKFSYHEDPELKVKVLEMDYAGKDISMVFLLPDEGSSLDSLEKGLTCDTFKKAASSGPVQQVSVTMPKFETESNFNLVEPIQNVGIKEIFGSNANFSGIAGGIAVSDAVQKAVIKVYEEGSEAAALTGIVMTESASFDEPEELVFRADHPFIYFIRDKRTNLILFMGRVKDLPNAE